MIDIRMLIARQCPIAAGRIGIQATPRLDSKISRFLHCLHGEIIGRLDDHSPLPTVPGDNGWPVFVVMVPTGLAFPAAAMWSAPQGFWATMFGSTFLPSSKIEVIRFHCTRHLAISFIGDGRIAQPPAPA